VRCSQCISRLKLHYLSCVKPPTLSTLDLCLSRYQNLEKLELGDLDLNALGQSITTLSKLAEIDLYGNQLTEFPQQLCQLLMLKKINLRRNPSLQGRIPPEIANLNQLQDLDLGDTMMIDIRHLENLPQLSRLSIEQRWRKSEVPHRIEIFPRSLPALKRITLSSDNFAGMIPALPQSQCLEIEILGGNIAVDLSLLVQLQNLRSLSISGSSIVNLNALVNLQNLEDLDLCANCDVLDLEPIFQIKSLQSLEISGNPMTPILDRFDELPNLTRVIVRNMKLQTLPETLVRHPQLHMLDPNDNNFSSSYEDYLEENCAAYANRPIDMAYQ
jgi:Leucine-rich repeat (LRR) protein